MLRITKEHARALAPLHPCDVLKKSVGLRLDSVPDAALEWVHDFLDRPMLGKYEGPWSMLACNYQTRRKIFDDRIDRDRQDRRPYKLFDERPLLEELDPGEVRCLHGKHYYYLRPHVSRYTGCAAVPIDERNSMCADCSRRNIQYIKAYCRSKTVHHHLCVKLEVPAFPGSTHPLVDRQAWVDGLVIRTDGLSRHEPIELDQLMQEALDTLFIDTPDS